MHQVERVERIGAAMGIVGALLVALNLPISGYGYVPFLISSASWTVVGFWQRNRRLWSMNLAFTAINLIGIYRWLLA